MGLLVAWQLHAMFQKLVLQSPGPALDLEVSCIWRVELLESRFLVLTVSFVVIHVWNIVCTLQSSFYLYVDVSVWATGVEELKQKPVTLLPPSRSHNGCRKGVLSLFLLVGVPGKISGSTKLCTKTPC